LFQHVCFHELHLYTAGRPEVHVGSPYNIKR
jgi:hypothetical protein